MQNFPLFLVVEGRSALVVGDGEAAARKARLLRSAGACVTVLARTPGAELRTLVEAGEVTLLERAFACEDVDDCVLVIAEADDETLAARVSAAAQAVGVPVNVIDRPGLSTFIMPAIVDRDPIIVAISSGGTAPVLARRVRARIEAMLPSNLGRLARFADAFRGAVRSTRGAGSARRSFWERFFAGPIADAVLAGDERWAREQMLCALNRADEGEAVGRVFLVGAGPGDPELMTLRTLRLLQEADVIVHDRLVGPKVLDYARRDAERIDVGKAPGRHACTQDEINALLATRAQAGQRVVRLKGGDPFVFGRGGEERAYLRDLGIPVEVVPGVTAAVGCAAAAGIPLTHRDAAQTLTLVTAAGRDGEPDLDWPALARGAQTLAVYMGARAAGRIAERLIQHGRDPRTPAAVVARATLPEQRCVVGELHALGAMVEPVDDGPVLILVGDVVRHADAWTTQDPVASRRRAVAGGAGR